MEYLKKRILVDHHCAALSCCSDGGSTMGLSDDAEFSKCSSRFYCAQNFVHVAQSLSYSHLSFDQNIEEVTIVTLSTYHGPAIKVLHDTALDKLLACETSYIFHSKVQNMLLEK